MPTAAGAFQGGGILKQLEVDRLSVRDAVELTITLSDNVATNLVLERCGGSDAVNAYLDSLGLNETRMLGSVDFARVTRRSRGRDRRLDPARADEALHGARARRDPDARPVRLPAGRPRTPALPRPAPSLARLEHVRAVPRPRLADLGREQDRRARRRPRRRRHRPHAEAARSSLAVFTDGARDLRETVDVEGSLAVAECSAAICARLLGCPTT